MKTDRFTIQMVVIFIGATCLLSIGGLIVLSFIGRPAPEPLTTLGATAIGALGSMLARTSTETALRGAESSPPDDPNPPDVVPLKEDKAVDKAPAEGGGD